MKPRDLMIRCLAMREGDHWVAICLPFDLAVQAATVQEARLKLDEQIRDYLVDALGGEDRQTRKLLAFATRSCALLAHVLDTAIGQLGSAHAVDQVRDACSTCACQLLNEQVEETSRGS